MIRWICWSIVIAQRLGAGCPLHLCGGTITFAKMPSPIGLLPRRQLIASRQPDQTQELTLDRPMPEVTLSCLMTEMNRNSEMTLPCFFLD